MFTKLSEHFEFRHFQPHYLDVDTIFGDLRRECLHQRVVRNTIFRKAPPVCDKLVSRQSYNAVPFVTMEQKKKLQLKHKNSLFTFQTFYHIWRFEA
jgi:hypothetical protein